MFILTVFIRLFLKLRAKTRLKLCVLIWQRSEHTWLKLDIRLAAICENVIPAKQRFMQIPPGAKITHSHADSS